MIANEGAVDSLLRTLEALCRIDSMHEYLVGFTRLPAKQKAREYRKIGFHHFVILADKMTRAEGKQLESAIQAAIFSGSHPSLLKKYHAQKKAYGRVISSHGGSTADPLAKECSVYVVWYEPS